MKAAGIISFKIEGRNRSPEYVHTVTSEYRKALDKKLNRKEILESIESLKRVYHRGQSSGFYFKMPTADDFSFSEHGDQKESKAFVGKAYKYWPKIGVCSVKMNAGKLSVGDDVYLMSDDMGVKRAGVKNVRLNDKDVKSVKKGDDAGVDFGIEIKAGAEVYVISKR